MGNMDWVDQQEEKNKEERGKEYFDIEEGENKFQLLTHCAPLPLVWNNGEKKYEVAEEGDKNISIKGLCFVLQDGIIKLAKLPYTVVKDIRALQNNEDWEFELPFEHVLTLTAKGAKTKEVDYSLTCSPKTTPISEEILAELAKKDTPEVIVEKMKEKRKGGSKPKKESKGVEYPIEDINPDDVPF
jgi:hypothetical protein